MDLAELVPAVGTHSRAAWRAAGLAPGHEDCNGRMPSIAKDVFTKMDDRRDRGEDEEEIDYVSARGSGAAEGTTRWRAGIEQGGAEGRGLNGAPPEWAWGEDFRRVSRGQGLDCPPLSGPTLGTEALLAYPGWGEASGLARRVRRSSSGHTLLDSQDGWRRAALGSTDLPDPAAFSCQTLCFRVRKMIDVYKPDWCEVREDWSVYLFSPENRWAGPGLGCH